MTELFNSLVATMKKYPIDPAPFVYMDPETGEDVCDPLPFIYYYESSLEDFVEVTKEVQIPDGICTGVDIMDTEDDTYIWAGDKLALKIDRFWRRVVVDDYELVEDKHLYKLIEIARKEVLPSR